MIKAYFTNFPQGKLASVENNIAVVLEAGDGNEFLQLMKIGTVKPDVVLMDIEMNEFNGIETITDCPPFILRLNFVMLNF